MSEWRMSFGLDAVGAVHLRQRRKTRTTDRAGQRMKRNRVAERHDTPFGAVWRPAAAATSRSNRSVPGRPREA